MTVNTATRERQLGPAPEAELARVDAWWRAANHLPAGQIYLLDNRLLALVLPGPAQLLMRPGTPWARSRGAPAAARSSCCTAIESTVDIRAEARCSHVM
ncbi:phosphoketolase family protein [Prauserella flavalba]|uniref:hypothetical protein n=1 Tax=Prauserella flavalba TaxID=1477506 RepID=UPI0036E76CED